MQEETGAMKKNDEKNMSSIWGRSPHHHIPDFFALGWDIRLKHHVLCSFSLVENPTKKVASSSFLPQEADV